MLQSGPPPWLRGFVYAYHPAVMGWNPMHTIKTFFICIIETLIDIGTRKGRK